MFHIWKCDQTFVVTDIDLELCAYRIELFFEKGEPLVAATSGSGTNWEVYFFYLDLVGRFTHMLEHFFDSTGGSEVFPCGG